MICFTFPRALALACGLCVLSTISALPIPSTTVELSERVWPAAGQSGQAKIARNDDTNALRLARGEPLKKPVRKNKLKPRFDVAPSQAASTTDSETYDYVTCAMGGFTYYGSSSVVTGSTDQELVDACAEQAAQDGESTFAVEDGAGHCYTGVDGYADMEEACGSSSYAIYSQ